MWAPEHGLGSWGALAYLPLGMWNLPGPGIEPVSPALADEFSFTVPPRKSPKGNLLNGVKLPV